MKYRFVWAGAIALAVTFTSSMQTKADFTNINGTVLTNGVVLITTRTAQDGWFHTDSSSGLWDADDAKGPGDFTPGDAAMGDLLMDYGYTVRMVPERLAGYLVTGGAGLTVPPSNPLEYWDINAYPYTNSPNSSGTTVDPQSYYLGGNGLSGSTVNDYYSARLVIVSGSGSSQDMPIVNTNGVPIMMGEHSCLGTNRPNSKGEPAQICLYMNKSSGNFTTTNSANLWMKVLNPNHPIMQGIPLDAQGRVKIFRDPYPEELAHNAAAEAGGSSLKWNYEISWTYADIAPGKSIPAAGLNIIGVLDSTTNYVVFATLDAGATLGDTSGIDADHPWVGRTTAPYRLVHFFVNEGGSGQTRRAFNALTDLGKVIFIRTCKWAMGETLSPYQPLGLIRVSQVTPQQVRLAWNGSSRKSYKVLGTQNLFGPADFSNWQTVAQDIAGVDGEVAVTFDVSHATQYAFLRVMPVP